MKIKRLNASPTLRNFIKVFFNEKDNGKRSKK